MTIDENLRLVECLDDSRGDSSWLMVLSGGGAIPAFDVERLHAIDASCPSHEVVGSFFDFEAVDDAMLRAGAPTGDDHELQQDPVAAVARRLARALARARAARSVSHGYGPLSSCGCAGQWRRTEPRRC